MSNNEFQLVAPENWELLKTLWIKMWHNFLRLSFVIYCYRVVLGDRHSMGFNQLNI